MNSADLLAVISSASSGLGAQPGFVDPFHATLQLGEIIQGRVMRSLGSGRYAVDFRGFERVVDSAIPLRTDEILYGRVAAIGDRVELQRIHSEMARGRSREESQPKDVEQPVLGGVPAAIAELRKQWSPEEVVTIEHLSGQAANPSAMTLGASALAKVGLPFSRELVEMVYSILSRRSAGGTFPLRSNAIVVETARAGERADTMTRNPVAAAAFAQLLNTEFDSSRQMLVQSPGSKRSKDSLAEAADKHEAEPEQSSQGGGTFGEAELGGALFNIQIEGAVSHAVATLPFIVDGRLVELDVALFQQGKNTDGGGALAHGRVVIALNTEHLGRVQIVANLVGDHVHLDLTSDDSGAADYMAAHAPALRSQVEADGWIVDELRYGLGDPSKLGAVPRTVMEHVVSKDSFSRLV